MATCYTVSVRDLNNRCATFLQLGLFTIHLNQTDFLLNASLYQTDSTEDVEKLKQIVYRE